MVTAGAAVAAAGVNQFQPEFSRRGLVPIYPDFSKASSREQLSCIPTDRAA